MNGRTWSFLAALMLAGALSARSVAAQEPSNTELKKEMQALSDAVKAMQQDLKDIKALLQRGGPPAPPHNAVLDLGNRPSRGKATASLTLVEFSDFQCPFCERHVRETEPQLAKEYIETGRLREVFMDFPLEAIHKFAFKAPRRLVAPPNRVSSGRCTTSCLAARRRSPTSATGPLRPRRWVSRCRSSRAV